MNTKLRADLEDCLRLTKRNIEPGDSGLHGWEPIAVKRLEIIQHKIQNILRNKS